MNHLLVFLRAGARITKTSESPICGSGLPYYFVELTCDDGSHYALQAYDEEAVALYEDTMKVMKAQELETELWTGQAD